MSQNRNDDVYVAGYVVEVNTLGLAGFIISLVGLVITGGILCPIGLIISLIAMGRRPRGFAVAGLIIGLLGTCGGLIVLILFGAAILAALGMAAVAMAMSDAERWEISSDLVTITSAVQQYRDLNRGTLPASLGDLHLQTAALTDPWGATYDYHFIDEDPGFVLISAGPDGLFGTEDDVSLDNLEELWRGAFDLDEIKRTMEQRQADYSGAAAATDTAVDETTSSEPSIDPEPEPDQGGDGLEGSGG